MIFRLWPFVPLMPAMSVFPGLESIESMMPAKCHNWFRSPCANFPAMWRRRRRRNKRSKSDSSVAKTLNPTYRYDIAQHINDQNAQRNRHRCDNRKATAQRWMGNFNRIDGWWCTRQSNDNTDHTARHHQLHKHQVLVDSTRHRHHAPRNHRQHIDRIQCLFTSILVQHIAAQKATDRTWNRIYRSWNRENPDGKLGQSIFLISTF